MELRICHLYPDVLNLYGDRGNIMSMANRLKWRGIDCTVTNINIGQRFNPDDYDLFFIGGGQDFEQEVLLADLKRGKANAIKYAIEDEKVMLAICGGYQMLGDYYQTWDGHQYEFIGAIDFYTVGGKKRMIGDYMFQLAPKDENLFIVGFENHSGRTFLGKQTQELGKIVIGNGNNGKDRKEGVRYKNVYGTYSHGPILPKNYKFCDLLLKRALRRRYPAMSLEAIDNTFEERAYKYMYSKLYKLYSKKHG